MRFLLAFGLVAGFAYEAGQAWYATWSPQAQVRDRPHFGSDVIILYGLIGAFWGCLLAAVIGAVYRKLRERHRINTAELVRQTGEAEQEVWPPPPTNQVDQTGIRQETDDDPHT